MEGNGITNRGIVINMGKRRDRMIKKPRILGKIIRNRFDQPKSASLFTSYLYLLAIPTTTPSLIFFIHSRL
jgi:hypothetical protein